ncbi:MAG: WD40 repeat domain-containing protein [Patescibacteria group bacterium]|jgi:WD40 repeat protein|nr:WD40 repeat domain-containing protein [Patescibacteria group bacterium]
MRRYYTEKQTLKCGDTSSRKVAVSKDYTYLISGLWNGAIYIWKISSGTIFHQYTEHSEAITDLVITSDNKVVSASYDGNICIWDMNTSERLYKTKKLGLIKKIFISDDGQYAGLINSSNRIRFLNLNSFTDDFSISTKTREITSVISHKNGRYYIIGSFTGEIEIWDNQNSRSVLSFKAHNDPITNLAIDKRGIFYSASWDCMIKAWDISCLPSVKQSGVLIGHTSWILNVNFADDNTLISCSTDRTIRTWDITKYSEKEVLFGHTSPVVSISAIPPEQAIISSSVDHTIKIWRKEKSKKDKQFHKDSVWGVKFDQKSETIISSSADRSAGFHWLNSKKQKRLDGHQSWVNNSFISCDGNIAISASADNQLMVWDIESGYHLNTLSGHSRWVNDVVISQDNVLAVSGSADWTVRVWDLKNKVEKFLFTGHKCQVTSVDLTSNNSLAISASADHTIKIWSLYDQKNIKTLIGHNGAVTSISLAHEENIIISGSLDGSLRLWDFKNNDESEILQNGVQRIWNVSIMPNAEKAVSISGMFIYLWDINNKTLLYKHANKCIFTACAISPDGKLFIGADLFGKIHLFDTEKEKKIDTI